MSANGSVSLVWAGGEDVFCLSKVGLILDLEDKCKAGIGIIAGRLESGSYGLNDIRETIRLGLIGGGATPERAMASVRNHVDGNPLSHSVLVAYAVVRAVLFGTPVDDPVGKQEPEATENPGSTMTTDASVDLK
ncbi:gene transfer agent family protein [Bradyrhizobium australafricanum]|uniref:gene transfer agent family protein n=1 Tax=Bradyrhizobium australafricanum TaxID=2821406 RepID=UPI001CE2D055|nr:gene transfer agent family protein [Bradyrhizobium australafricanum]MCA6098867.1 gene transfer agent family protein [Bradyrhizobium australafricanum]